VDGHGAVTPRSSENANARGALIAVPLLIGVGLALWLAFGRNTAASVGPAEQPTHGAAAVTEPQQSTQGPAPRQLPVPAAAPTQSAKPRIALVDVATDGLPYMPASPDAPAPAGPVHPHRITAEHERIFRENATIQTLNDAMDSKDARGLRRFLTRYRLEYPEDAQQLQQGYELIANCLEERSGYREAAQRYFDEETASSLRRFVLRHCLGGP
jgi:hypothetical protein